MEYKFPIGIFPSSLRSIIEEVSHDRQFPLDYLSGAILWVMAVLIGATAYLKTTLGKTYVNLYLMLVGAQGANKSAPLAWATEYLHRLDYAAIERMERDLPEYEADIARGENPEKPIAHRYLIDASTPEAIIKILRENPKGAGQCSDEISKAFKDLGRYARSSDEEIYLRLFNGDTMTVDRATRQDVLHVTAPCFSLCGTIQNHVFNHIFTRDKVENGLLARFLEIVHYEEGALLWNLSEDLPSDVDTRYENYIAKMLERRDETDIQEPEEYSLMPDAAEVIQTWQNDHEFKIENYGREIDRATFRKIQIYVLKFALIIQIMWDVNTNSTNDGHSVNYQSAVLATLLADYFFRNAKDLSRSVYVRKLSETEKRVYEALPNKFTSENGLIIAKKHGLGKTCYFDLLNKMRGILIDQPARGRYVKRFPK